MTKRWTQGATLWLVWMLGMWAAFFVLCSQTSLRGSGARLATFRLSGVDGPAWSEVLGAAPRGCCGNKPPSVVIRIDGQQQTAKEGDLCARL